MMNKLITIRPTWYSLNQIVKRILLPTLTNSIKKPLVYFKSKFNKTSNKKLKTWALNILNSVVKLLKAKKKEKVVSSKKRRKISTMAAG